MSTSPISVKALIKMREGLLYIFVGWLLFILLFVFMFFGMFVAVGMHMELRPHNMGRYFTWLPVMMWAFIPAIVGVVVGGALTLVGLYMKFIPGVEELAASNPDFSTSSTLIKLGYLWGIVLIIVGSVLTPLTYGMSFIVFVLGIILLILGHIGMAVLCLKLNDIERNTVYLIAGIIFIISIIVPVLIMISLILLYVALGDSVRKHSEQKALTT